MRHQARERSKRYALEEGMESDQVAERARSSTRPWTSRFASGSMPKKTDQLVRGSVSLPKGTGKSIKIAVFADGDKAKEAQEAAGADYVGAADLAEKIEKGFTDFDMTIASPDMMRFVGKLGKVLGPQGKMPSPKAGTVTPNVAQAVQASSKPARSSSAPIPEPTCTSPSARSRSPCRRPGREPDRIPGSLAHAAPVASQRPVHSSKVVVSTIDGPRSCSGRRIDSIPTDFPATPLLPHYAIASASLARLAA